MYLNNKHCHCVYLNLEKEEEWKKEWEEGKEEGEKRERSYSRQVRRDILIIFSSVLFY